MYRPFAILWSAASDKKTGNKRQRPNNPGLGNTSRSPHHFSFGGHPSIPRDSISLETANAVENSHDVASILFFLNRQLLLFCRKFQTTPTRAGVFFRLKFAITRFRFLRQMVAGFWSLSVNLRILMTQPVGIELTFPARLVGSLRVEAMTTLL